MLHKKLILTLTFIALFSFSVYSADKPGLSAQSAVLMNAETKEIIYEKNAHTQRSMASTTKIMTSILAIESGRLSEVVTAENVNAEGSSIGLKNGYKLTLETLTYGMMLESGNDAAELTAEFLGGTEDDFAVLMNNKAREIGMYNTNFVTASGLDSKEHYSTAYDMALLGAYATQNPIFHDICSTKTKRVNFIEPDISITFSNHNKLLSWCDGVFGIKTGFTKKSGRCLVSACERNGRVLIAVTLNAGDDWNDHMKLYDYGFDVCDLNEIYIRLPETVKVYGGLSDDVSLAIKDNPVRLSYTENMSNITQKVYLPDFLYAPINSGDVIGKVDLLCGETIIASYDICSLENAGACEPAPEQISLWTRIKDKINEILN